MSLVGYEFDPAMRANAYFGGAGGSSHGLHLAGFDVVGYDYWQPAVNTHNANGMVAHMHDLSDPSLDKLLAPCEVAWFSTPCQPFSAAGEGEGEFDERDGFPWALRILAKTLPPVVFFENVKGLTFGKHRAYLSGILASIRALGYTLDHKVLNCADYGVPQTRERFIIIARLDGGPITWPTVTHTEMPGMFTEQWQSFAEAVPSVIGRLPIYNRGKGMIERHGERPPADTSAPAPAPAVTGNTHKDLLLHYRQTNRDGEPITCNLTDRPSPTIGTQAESQWLVTAGQDKRATQRALDQPAPTVLGRKDPHAWTITRPSTTIAGDSRVFQPGGHHEPGEQSANSIRLTMDELATLQGFPQGWQWTGNKTEQARQIGNAVPPRLAEVLARANVPLPSAVAA